MPNVVRYRDVCTGHGCFGSRPNNQGSPDVFANGLAVHRQTDSWETHCCVDCHDSNLAQGSSSVFSNNLPVARIGDPVACGSSAKTGSPTVFAG